jgi:hypothetical protein
MGELGKFLGVLFLVLFGLFVLFGFVDDVLWFAHDEGLYMAVLIALGNVAAMGLLVTPSRTWLIKWVNARSTTIMRKEAQQGPIYGDPVDTPELKGDDRPLPRELCYRVAVYSGRMKDHDAEGFRARVAAASSFNAFVRGEMQKGRL